MEYLYNYAQLLGKELLDLPGTTFSDINTLEIDCSILPKMGEEGDCRFHPGMMPFFQELQKIQTQPALYWFEVMSDHPAKVLHETIPGLNALIDRSVPAFRKGFNNWDSKYLYVGKVKSKIVDRMVVHFGYGRDKRTQGLQLCHWATEKGLKLKLNYVSLPVGMAEMAGIFEVHLAKELKPVFGRHK